MISDYMDQARDVYFVFSENCYAWFMQHEPISPPVLRQKLCHRSFSRKILSVPLSEFDFTQRRTWMDDRRYCLLHNQQKVWALLAIFEFKHRSSGGKWFPVNHSFRSNESKPVLSDDLKSKIRSWNRADSALFDAVNSTFWAKIQNFGFDNMEMEVKKLRSGLRIATVLTIQN